MKTITTSRPHSAGVLAALETTGKPVGDGVAPDGAAPPYTVLYDIPGGSIDGTMGDPDADAIWAYQVTSIGATADQARWMADKNTVALSGGTELDPVVLAVTGRRVKRNERVGGPGGIRRDDDLGKPILFSHVAIWHVHTTPSS